MTDHDAKGVELKAEAASLRERGEKQAFGENDVDDMELKVLTSTGSTTP
jgi:hypothetical protein